MNKNGRPSSSAREQLKASLRSSLEGRRCGGAQEQKDRFFLPLSVRDKGTRDRTCRAACAQCSAIPHARILPAWLGKNFLLKVSYRSVRARKFFSI